MVLLRAYLETLRRSDGKRVDLPPTGAFVPAISRTPATLPTRAGITCLMTDRSTTKRTAHLRRSTNKKGPLT